MAKKVVGPKAKAWESFSRWVKVRDCLATTGVPFVGVCITCNCRFHIRVLQAGHCFPGRKNGRLFQKELVHAQCRMCNEGGHGKPKEYREAMDAQYTKVKVDAWEIEGGKVIHDRDMDFEGIEAKYKEKTNALLKGLYGSYDDMLKGQAAW